MERDYERWPNLGRKPQTLHEHFRVDPLWCSTYPQYAKLHAYFCADPRGADSFKKWIEDRICELLQRPATWTCLDQNGGGVEFGATEAYKHLLDAIEYVEKPESRRFSKMVKLLDGTVIKEWPADASEVSTGRASNRADRAVE